MTLINGFHGRTVTTLAATGQDVFHQNFFPLTEGFLYTPANDLPAFIDLCEKNPNVCAVMMESIQGEGGATNSASPYFCLPTLDLGVSLWESEDDGKQRADAYCHGIVEVGQNLHRSYLSQAGREKHLNTVGDQSLYRA